MREIDKRALGRRIREVRRETGLRQWELARRLGTTQSAIHKYEHGVVPEPGRLLEIARIGNTSMEWLLTGRHGDAGGAQRERPSDEAQRTAEAVLRLERSDRERLEEAIRLLRAAGDSLERAAETADLLEAARRVHGALLAHLFHETAARLEGEPSPTSRERGGIPEAPRAERGTE